MIILVQSLLIVLFALGTMSLANLTGFVLLTPLFFIFIIVPGLDWMCQKLGYSGLYKKTSSFDYKYSSVPLYLYAILNFISLIFFMWAVKDNTLLDIALKAAGAVMFQGGACVVHGHELGHHKSKISRLIGNLCLSSFGYGHFVLEHFQGHHKRAATPEDPSSAQKNESFWRFLPRTFLGQLTSAYFLEKNNIKHQTWKFETSIIVGFSFTLFLFIISFILSGKQGFIYFLLHCIFAILLLEVGNYVEHYGLSRSKKENKYEKFQAHHSWTSDAPVTNIILFNLPFHSSHHVSPQASYLTLINEPTAPKLPAGHFVMIVLALFPSAWYKIINPILNKHGLNFSTPNLPESENPAIINL